MPVFNEAEHIGAVLADVQSVLTESGMSFEFILVDDGSTDETWERLVELSKEYPNLKAANLSRNFGKDIALCAGLEMSGGDAAVIMDGDGQHPPSLLPQMIEAWAGGGVDIVEATKLDRGKETVFNKLSAKLFYLLWNKLSGFELRGASDYKLLDRRVVDAYLQMDERHVFFRGMTAWLGFSRIQIPFEVAERAGGSSGWSLLKRIRLAVDGISGFSAIPLQIITVIGVFFLLFSLVFGIYTLILQVTGRSVSGFATVILLLLIIGSLLMISLGIIGIYIARIYDEIKHRPRYVIARTIESVDMVNRSNARPGSE